MAVTHILFDFFGTLVEYDASHVAKGCPRTHAVLVEAGGAIPYERFVDEWDVHFEAFDRRADDCLREYSMDDLTAAYLREQLGRDADETLVATFRDVYLEEWSQGVRYVPGAGKLLADLSQRFTLALVTNTHHAPLVHGHLRAMQAEHHFATLVTSVEHGRRKPSACIFHSALTRCDGVPERAIYVGDSFDADYRGATGAGLSCLLIDPERRHDVPDGDRIDDIHDLRRLLLAD